MKSISFLILAVAISLLGLSSDDGHRRRDDVQPTATGTDAEAATPTEPFCIPPEFYDPVMGRCRLPDETPEPTGTPEPTDDPAPYSYQDGSITQWCNYGTADRPYWTGCVDDGTPTPTMPADVEPTPVCVPDADGNCP